MKTRLLIDSKRRKSDYILLITGWVLAVLVSLLYLQKLTAEFQSTEPQTLSPVRVEDKDLQPSREIPLLLGEAEFALARGRREQALEMVTRLWAFCHATGQEVPAASHRIFAQAVSELARATPPPRRGQFHATSSAESAADSKGEREPSESRTVVPNCSVPKKAQTVRARLKLPPASYPKAKPLEKKPEVQAPPPPPEFSEIGIEGPRRRPEDFPGEMRRPKHLPRPPDSGDRSGPPQFPPPPPPSGSPPPRRGGIPGY